MKNLLFIFCFIALFSTIAHAQSVGINTDGSTPNASAMLDVKSTNKGVLVPRMTTANMNAIASPAAGLLIYNTTTNSFWYRKGSTWTDMSPTGGTAVENVNVSDNMPTNFTTTARGAEWLTMDSKLQAQAPSAGTYLILYSLRANNFTDSDLVYFGIANAITGVHYTGSVQISPQNGLNDATASSFYIANLVQGETVQVREKMEGTGTTQVYFEDGKLSLIKLQ